MPSPAPLFTGKLYDGLSAEKISVYIRAAPSGLILSLPDQNDRVWPYAELRLTEVGGPRVPTQLEREVKKGGPRRTETLVISHPSFLKHVEDVAPDALGSVWEKPRHKKTIRALLVLAVIVIPLSFYFVWKVAIPFGTDALVPHLPVAWEEQLGESTLQIFFGDKLEPPNPEVQKALDEITRRLLEPVPNQPYNFRIFIHPADIFNAMALPGGTIIVFQGLLDKTETPEELAGVLAHEFQHVLQRHPTRNLVRQLGLSIILAMMVGDSGDALGIILQVAGQMGGMAYTREMEAEADEKGMKMMLAGGVDPQGMISIFEKLMIEGDKLTGAAEGPVTSDGAVDSDEPGDSDKNKSPDSNIEALEEGDDSDGAPDWMEYFSTHPKGQNRVTMLNKLSQEGSAATTKPLLPDTDWEIMFHASDGKEASWGLFL